MTGRRTWPWPTRIPRPCRCCSADTTGPFPRTPTYRVGTNPESVVVGDFNRDSNQDLAVANAGSHTVSVLLGNGDGTFQPALTFAAGRGPTSVALGDFNRDAVLDLVVSNYGSNNYYSDIVATTVSVLQGNGDGTFQAPQAFEAGSGPNDVAVGDFNGDTYQDLAVADYGPFTAASHHRFGAAWQRGWHVRSADGLRRRRRPELRHRRRLQSRWTTGSGSVQLQVQ